jgi:hypothetical protein
MIDPMAGLAVVIVVLLALVFGAGYLKRRPKMLDAAYFQGKWKEAQGFCKDKTTWPLAIINADKLLDDALKRRRFKGKTMGERMVAAQRELSDNDGVWFAHKLRNRLVHEADVTLKENDVKKALIGIRQALKDLGAQVK